MWFAHKAGSVIRARFGADWSLEARSTVRFAEHAGKGGGTAITVEWTPINASAVEHATFDSGRAGMEQGWTGTLDQLSEYLATNQ